MTALSEPIARHLIHVFRANAEVLGESPEDSVYVLTELSLRLQEALALFEADTVDDEEDDPPENGDVSEDDDPVGDAVEDEGEAPDEAGKWLGGIDMTATPAWPASADVIMMIVEAGISDTKATRIFHIHPRTFATRRRRLIGAKTEALDGVAPNPADYGVDPQARWPDGVRFENDPVVVRATCRGRLPSRPETILPTASTVAF